MYNDLRRSIYHREIKKWSGNSLFWRQEYSLSIRWNVSVMFSKCFSYVLKSQHSQYRTELSSFCSSLFLSLSYWITTWNFLEHDSHLFYRWLKNSSKESWSLKTNWIALTSNSVNFIIHNRKYKAYFLLMNFWIYLGRFCDLSRTIDCVSLLKFHWRKKNVRLQSVGKIHSCFQWDDASFIIWLNQQLVETESRRISTIELLNESRTNDRCRCWPRTFENFRKLSNYFEERREKTTNQKWRKCS